MGFAHRESAGRYSRMGQYRQDNRLQLARRSCPDHGRRNCLLYSIFPCTDPRDSDRGRGTGLWSRSGGRRLVRRASACGRSGERRSRSSDIEERQQHPLRDHRHRGWHRRIDRYRHCCVQRITGGPESHLESSRDRRSRHSTFPQISFSEPVRHTRYRLPAAPDYPEEWRDVWLSAAITSLLFSIGKYLIGLYIGSSNMASSYGAASALINVFVWVYYSAQIFLFGAEFAKAYGNQRRRLQC